MLTTASPVSDLPEAFLLVPLQMEWDTNIRRHVSPKFRRMQGLVAHISSADPPFPVIYKQHPADIRRGNQQLRLRMPRPQDQVRPHGDGNIHQILKSGRCRGIISLNSNVVHDGLVWDVPAIVLGNNVWPRSEDGPFLTSLPEKWSDLAAQMTDTEKVACRRAYAYYLMCNQWKLEDARDESRVEALLSSVATESTPKKAVHPMVGARVGKPLVNVAAQNKGWFFEDLKQHFLRSKRDDARIAVSDRPRRDADAWIIIRTKEAAASPAPSRTVVQIHDMFDNNLYRRGGERASVSRCGGISLTHPDQRGILERSGIDPSGKLVLEQPVGALEAFKVRDSLAGLFTVAWVGRPVMHLGKELKRVDGFVEAIERLDGEFRVVLLGERLEKQYARLLRAGIACAYHPRSRNPIEKYPKHYAGFDCVVIYSVSEAGPLCLFESLASGVPVVSSPVGWTPILIRDGVNGKIVTTVKEMTEAIHSIRAHRREWFDRRLAIHESLKGRTLESWVDKNIEMAVCLATGKRAFATDESDVECRPVEKITGWQA
jgi:glycosyltransferase involved in cell wall biosynthesis